MSADLSKIGRPNLGTLEKSGVSFFLYDRLATDRGLTKDTNMLLDTTGGGGEKPRPNPPQILVPPLWNPYFVLEMTTWCCIFGLGWVVSITHPHSGHIKVK